MKLTNPFLTGFPGGGGSIPSGKGHLFGDALFNADFFQLQNTEGEEIIKYTKEGGLEIAGGGGGGCEIVKYTAASQAAITEMAEAITAVVEAGKMPILITGTTTKLYWHCVSASPDEIIFVGYTVNVVAATISATIKRIYKQDGTWMRSGFPVDFE